MLRIVPDDWVARFVTSPSLMPPDPTGKKFAVQEVELQEGQVGDWVVAVIRWDWVDEKPKANYEKAVLSSRGPFKITEMRPTDGSSRFTHSVMVQNVRRPNEEPFRMIYAPDKYYTLWVQRGGASPQPSCMWCGLPAYTGFNSIEHSDESQARSRRCPAVR